MFQYILTEIVLNILRITYIEKSHYECFQTKYSEFVVIERIHNFHIFVSLFEEKKTTYFFQEKSCKYKNNTCIRQKH